MAIYVEWQVKPPGKNEEKPQMFPRITDTEIYPDSDRRMRSIVVRDVNFQPAQAFMDTIGKPSFQWRPTTGMATAPSVTQIVP